MEMMRKFTTNVRSRLTRLCNHDTPASVKPIGYVGDMKQLRTTWVKLTESLVICEDKTATMLMSAVHQSPSATRDMRDQIVDVYMPNFSSNACDGELIGSLFPTNLSGKEKKAFANAKKAGATSLMRHMNAASGDSLDRWYSDAAKRENSQMRLLLALSGVTNLRCSAYWPMLANIFVHALAPSPAERMRGIESVARIVPSAWMQDFRQRVICNLIYGTYLPCFAFLCLPTYTRLLFAGASGAMVPNDMNQKWIMFNACYDVVKKSEKDERKGPQGDEDVAKVVEFCKKNGYDVIPAAGVERTPQPIKKQRLALNKRKRAMEEMVAISSDSD